MRLKVNLVFAPQCKCGAFKELRRHSPGKCESRGPCISLTPVFAVTRLPVSFTRSMFRRAFDVCNFFRSRWLDLIVGHVDVIIDCMVNNVWRRLPYVIVLRQSAQLVAWQPRTRWICDCMSTAKCSILRHNLTDAHTAHRIRFEKRTVMDQIWIIMLLKLIFAMTAITQSSLLADISLLVCGGPCRRTIEGCMYERSLQQMHRLSYASSYRTELRRMYTYCMWQSIERCVRSGGVHEV